MKFRHLVSFTHICYLTVNYDVYRMSRAHLSHFSLTTEMDSSLVLVSFRTLYVFDLNEVIDVYDSMTFMILSHKCSVVVVKVLNT